MKILVVNAGSSSLKYQLFDMDTESVIVKGGVERIGIRGSVLHHKWAQGEKVIEQDMPNHKVAMQAVLDALVHPEYGAIHSMSEIDAVGHRVLHSGGDFDGSVLLDDEVLKICKKNAELGPLHMPANILGIEACREVMPHTPMALVFDTAFHATMPPHAYMYAVDYDDYKNYKVRKYGFHGTSHKYVAQTGAKLAGLDFENSKIITCHIGNGASVTAVLNGKSFDTSMGFSPVDGLVMGTRCGNVDPSAVTFIGEKEGMSYAELNEMMNKKSGVLGLTDLSSDMRDIDRAYDEGNPRAILARDMHYGRIRRFVGEYAAEMGGVDMIVFTGGVGENSCEMRESVCTGLEFMGVEFDREANKGARGVNKILSTPGSRVKVAVIATDEELVIATDTYNLVK